MAAQIKLDDLNALLEAGKALSSLLDNNPNIQAFAEIVAQAKEPVLVVDGDRLVLASEAARLLGVNKTRISHFVKEGLLRPWYLPGSTARRYRLSEVWALPKQQQSN
jgi:hypothetical protein